MHYQKYIPRKMLCLSALLSVVVAASQTQAATCSYKIDSEWNTGFTASIVIANTSSAVVNGWNVSWKYNTNALTSSWNTTLSGTNPYSAKDVGWNSAIQPGQSVSFGFQGNKNGGVTESPVVAGAICGTVVASSAPKSSIAKSSVAPRSSAPKSSVAPSSKAASSASGQQWISCANENQRCNFSGTKRVRYGAGTSWNEGNFSNGVACNNATFGDPIQGTLKTCQISEIGSDTAAPTPPSGLKLTNLACKSAVLSWVAATDDVGVAGYDVYHDGQKMVSVNGNQLSAALTLVPGAVWGFYVNAVDAAGNVSQASDTLSTSIPQCQVDTTSPTVPTNLKGAVTGTSASLNWVASTDNVAVTAYDIYRNGVKVGATAALNYTDTGLLPNTTYQYSVAARDAQSNVSARTANLVLTTGGTCNTSVCSVTQVTTDNDIPWGLVALPDGSILYNRRDAQDIIRLNPVTGVKTTVGTVPNVESTDGEGGLLGLAITPNFPTTDQLLYIYHTSRTDNRIVRIQYKNGVLDNTSLQVLLSGIGRNKFHNGGRLRFGPDGKLYAATGDAQSAESAQRTDNLTGKILRLNTDGSAPSDNPFPAGSAAKNYVWSYGHRNPQGLAFDSQGRLWEQEFGNSTMDETNLIVKGGNYGWPNCEGTTSQAGSGCNTAGYIAPKYTYSTAQGSCSGIAIVKDVLYLACLRGTRVYREVISGNELTNVEQLFVGTYGRLRTVEPTIDGGLWLTTTNSGDKDSIANNSDEKIFKVILGN